MIAGYAPPIVVERRSWMRWGAKQVVERRASERKQSKQNDPLPGKQAPTKNSLSTMARAAWVGGGVSVEAADRGRDALDEEILEGGLHRASTACWYWLRPRSH